MTTYRKTMAIAVLVAWLATPLPGQQQGAAQAALKAAIDKETIDGDLKGAIALYEKAVAAAKQDRAVAAKALVRMAECHQKLGSAESRKIYQRVVREYGDQKESADLAHARLGLGGSGGVKGDRPIWTGPAVDIFGRISPNGRLMTYVDWSGTGNLMLHDMATGSDHSLTKKKTWDDSPESASYSIFSPDGKQIAYEWSAGQGLNELRVAALIGTNLGEPKRLLAGKEIRSVRPYDWSADGKWIAVYVRRADLSAHLGLVSTRDGALKELQPLDWREPLNMAFSADGKFVVFDQPADSTSSQRDIFVAGADGGSSRALVSHPANDTFAGFTPDGRQILFGSDRAGSDALWAQPFADGRVQGNPINLKSDFGAPWIQGISRAGTIFVTKSVSDADLHIVPVDLNAGKVLGAPTGIQAFPVRGRPDWSPDGKFLSYIDCRGFGGGPCSIFVREMATGHVRNVRPSMHYIGFPRWSPDGRLFLTSGNNLKGEPGVYVVAAATGETTRAVAGRYTSLGWASDGKKYFARRGRVVVQREIGSDAEQEVFRLPDTSNGASISPDGRYFAYISDDSVLMVTPVSGGTPRELFRVQKPDGLVDNVVLSWVLNGSAVLVAKRVATGPRELWLVPVSGGQARKLDIDVSQWDILGGIGVVASPDSRQLTFMAGKAALEVWALEGLLEPVNAKR